MGSRKINKVGSQSPHENVTKKGSVKAEHGIKKKSVRHTGRTHRNNDSSFKDELSDGLEDAGAILKFLGKKVGSFFYAYYELGCAVAGALRDGAVKLKQCASFLFRSKASSDNENDLIIVPEVEASVPKQPVKSGPPINVPVIPTVKLKENPSIAGTTSSKPERKLITIEMSDIEGLTPPEVANIILGKICEIPNPNKKIILFLDDIAQGEPFERAARYFGSSHRAKRGDETLDSLMNNSRLALVSFVARNTNNQQIAEKIADIICVRSIGNQQVQIVDEDAVPEVIEDMVEQEQAEPVSEPADMAIVFPMQYPSTILPDTARRIRSYQDVIGLDSRVPDAFLQIVKLGEGIYSTLSSEEVILRVGFLQALSGLRIKNGVDKLPNDLFTLESEYQAFLQYCQIDDSIRAGIGTMLDSSASPELHAYSTKRDLAMFLSGKENDAFRAARTFIRNIIRIDTDGANGAIKLFRKAVEKEKLNPAYVFGYYAKAEAIVSLLGVFNRQVSSSGEIKMDIVDPNEIEKEDMRVETENKTYLIKVKSSFRRAVEGIEEIKSIAARTRGLNLFSDNKKEIIPVCVVNGAGSTLIDLERRAITEKTDSEFYCGLRVLAGIKNSFPRFELWDINGKSIHSELELEVAPGTGVLKIGLGA